MSGKIIELEQRLRAAQREIDSLKDHRSTLSGNYSALQQQCEALKAENQSLRSELGDANEMIAMMDEGSSHEADAALASLGRELGYDYRKYLAVADQPMTAELGSIVLGQLRTVFEILERHGIDLQ
jgi:FtsZ-binding cell division protein ZapB